MHSESPLPDCPFLLKYFEIGFILERGVYFDRSIVSVLSVGGKEGAAFSLLFLSFFSFFLLCFQKRIGRKERRMNETSHQQLNLLTKTPNRNSSG